jgi:autotransporter-associated beta strand protein
MNGLRKRSVGNVALLLAASIVAAGSSLARADAFSVGYEFAGSTGASTLAPSATATNVNLGSLTDGPGVLVGTATNAFGGVNWDEQTDLAGAITNNDYVSFTISATDGNAISLASISPYNVRRSGTGPSSSQWQFSLNGTDFTNIGTTLSWPSSSSSGQAAAGIDLSSIGALQNVASGTTVTLRIVNWGDTGSGGSWYFNNVAATSPDLVINGTVGPITVVLPNYLDDNGSAAGLGVSGGTTVWDTTTTNFTNLADGTGSPVAFDANQLTVFAGTAGIVNVSSVAPAKGLEFDTSGYVLNGGTITLVSVPTVSVLNAGDTATINSRISGSVGLTKGGAGTLVLGSVTNDFTGTVTINGGLLSISSDADLGNSANAVTINSGGLQVTANTTTARTITGVSPGPSIVDIASGATLATTGTVTMAVLQLSNVGTLDVQGGTATLGTVAFTAGGTLTSSTGQALNANTITATNLNGTATVSSTGGLNLGTGSKTVDVGANGTVVINTAVTLGGTANNSLRKTGDGTLELNGVNTGLYRVQLGSASVGSPTAGGTLKINNNQALGQNQFFLNNGTLQPTVDLTGANAVALGVSIGGLDNGPAALSGNNIEFTGATSFFQGNNAQSHLTVNNTTTFSGTFGSGTGTGTGATLDGTGTLVLNGDASGMTMATTLGGTLTLVVNNAWAAPITLNGGTLAGNGTIGAAVAAGTGAHSIAPGANLAAPAVATLTMNALTTSADTTLAFRLNTPAAASPNDAVHVTSADSLTVNGGNLVVTANTTGAGSLGYYKAIEYAGAIQGAGLSSIVLPAVQNGISYTLDAVHDPGFVDIHRGFLGDANDDGTVNFADFVQLSNNYGQPDRGWTGGDFNADGVTNFADFVVLSNHYGQAVDSNAIVVSPDEIAAFEAAAAHFGASAVPEPSTLGLLALAAAPMLIRRRKR